MAAKEAVLKQVRAAFEQEPRINLHSHPIHLSFDNGVLTLEGEVRDIAAKKLALELAGAADAVRGVVDRLRVAPAERKGDGAIRDVVRNFLLAEPTLQNCTLRLRLKGQLEVLRDAGAEECGAIEVAVEDRGHYFRRRSAQPVPQAAGGRACLVGAGLPRRGERAGGGSAGRGQWTR